MLRVSCFVGITLADTGRTYDGCEVILEFRPCFRCEMSVFDKLRESTLFSDVVRRFSMFCDTCSAQRDFTQCNMVCSQ